MKSSNEAELERILFADKLNFEDKNVLSIYFEQYKIIVETSERLVARRQTANTFFLTANTLILSAIGLILSLRENAFDNFAIYGVIVVAISGIFLCIAWYRLVRSYMQLNKGKYDVILLLERVYQQRFSKPNGKHLERVQSPKYIKRLLKRKSGFQSYLWCFMSQRSFWASSISVEIINFAVHLDTTPILLGSSRLRCEIFVCYGRHGFGLSRF